MFNKNINFTRFDFCFLIISSVLSFLGVLFYLIGYQSVLAVSLVIVNLSFLIKFLNKIPVFILFFYILLHSKIFVLFYLWNFSISFWSSFQNDNEIGPVMISLLLFIYVLGNVISSIRLSENFYLFRITKPNKTIFWIISTILVFILFFGIKGDNLLVSGGYNNFENIQKSTLHEYFILFFLLLIIYSPNYGLYRHVIILFLFFYVVKTLLYGGRIEVVQILLLFFYLFYLFKNKIKARYILLFLFLGIYFNGIVSNIRSNPEILLLQNYSSVFNPKEVFTLDLKNPYISSTEGDVVHSSARMVGLINTNELTISDRLISFFSYLVSPIIPPSYLSDLSNLSTYKQDLVQSGGGGLISTYFFCWMGYLGPIIAAFFIAVFINRFFELYSSGIYIYGLCLLTMFPRWFSYNPIFLIKFSLYAVMLLYITKTLTLNKTTKIDK
jgi:hypothetical protein